MQSSETDCLVAGRARLAVGTWREGLAASLLIGLVLAGCQSAGTGATPASLGSIASARSVFVGNTIVYHDDKYGTQVEYYRPDGTSYLWHAGGSKVLAGRWRVSGGEAGQPFSGEVCFAYPTAAVDRVPGDEVGGWDCADMVPFRATIVERVSGDRFGLSKAGTAPFDLPMSRTSIDRLVQDYQRKNGSSI